MDVVNDYEKYHDKILEDFADALRQENLVKIAKCTHLAKIALGYELIGSKDVVESMRSMVDQGEVVLSKWKSSIVVGDKFEIQDRGLWYEAKAVAEGKAEGVKRVHFNGWNQKADQHINLTTAMVYPAGTLFPDSKAKGASKTDKVESTPTPTTVETPSNDEMIVQSMETDVDTGRSRRKAAQVAQNSLSEKTPKKPKKEKKEKKSMEDIRHENSDWLCMLCGQFEAPNESKLLVCAGSCLRAVHCECIGIADETTLDDWYCDNCSTGRHACWICHEEGIDYVDVFKCPEKTCGKFYHLNCLENTDATFVRPSLVSKVTPKKLELQGKELELYWKNANQSGPCPSKYSVDGYQFKCPRHYCDTCAEFYGPIDCTSLEICFHCPRAFHANCISPGSRFNSGGLICPLHPDKILPSTSDKKLKISSSRFSIFWEQFNIVEAAHSSDDNAFYLDIKMKRDVDKTPKNYHEITKNDWSTFPEDKLPNLIIPEDGCECVGLCDERCLNHISRIECWDGVCGSRQGKICACGRNNCNNRALQRRQYVDTDIFKEGDMGWGLRTCQPVRKGQLIIEYMGEIIDEEEMVHRLDTQATLTPHDKDYYVMELDTGIYVDGKHKGNVSRFINHSCDPNCELQKWNVKGSMHIAIVACKDIAEGESLSYDYQFDTQEENTFKCYCGAAKCRGTMAPRKKDRIAAKALTSTDRELRRKLIKEGKANWNKLNDIATLTVEEMTRSYTGRFLPGDAVHELRHGAPKGMLQAGRQHHSLLVRNAIKSQTMLARKAMLEKRIAINCAQPGRVHRGKNGAKKAAR